VLSTYLHPRLPSGLFPSNFPINNLHAFLFSPSSCYMPHQPHHLRLENSNYVWQEQSTTLFDMQFSPPSRQFIPLWPKHYPHYLPKQEHPHSCHIMQHLLCCVWTGKEYPTSAGKYREVCLQIMQKHQKKCNNTKISFSLLSYMRKYFKRYKASSVGIATGYGLDSRRVRVWVPVGSRILRPALGPT
jgi:hypothetical protein